MQSDSSNPFNRLFTPVLFHFLSFDKSICWLLLVEETLSHALHCNSSHPDVEVSVLVTGADAEGVVSPRRDAGGLNLEDVGGDGALWGDGHVAVDDGERQISTGGLADGAHAAAGRTQWKESWWFASLWLFVCLCYNFVPVCNCFALFCSICAPFCVLYVVLRSFNWLYNEKC